MPRNGSGTCTVSNSFVTATTISSSAVNANFDDFASEISNSLPRDGQAAMTGQFKAASGTLASPGIAFSSSTGTGIRRSAADVMKLVVAGVDVGTINSTGVGDASGNVFTAIPAGTAMIFKQTAAPTGWTKVTSSDNAALRVVSGTAGTGGTADFTTVFAARTLLRSNLPNDTVTTGTESVTHTHAYNSVTASGAQIQGGSGWSVTGFTSGNASATHTHSFDLNGGVTQTAVDFAVKYVDVIVATKD